jgi:CRISPR-associated protein Cas1
VSKKKKGSGGDDHGWTFDDLKGLASAAGGYALVTPLVNAIAQGRFNHDAKAVELLTVLRGIEGSRVKEIYRLTAERIGIRWNGRRYDRSDPLSADLPNQALNHAASAVEAAAAIAVAATATIPQLGFIHEDSGQSFILDIADLFRDELTVPCAFKAALVAEKRPGESIERLTRRSVGERLRRDQVIPTMIDRIKALFAEEKPE